MVHVANNKVPRAWRGGAGTRRKQPAVRPLVKDCPPPSRMNSFDDVLERLEQRVEKIQLSGRYHRFPVTIDSQYDVCEDVLGSGCNGDVRLATSKLNPEHKFAVKAFDFTDLPPTRRAQLEFEVEVFLSMDHPHIGRLNDVYESNEHMDLVMECMEGGELFDRVQELKRFPQLETAELVWQMLLALNYIHEQGIMHGDVKMENFMFDSKDSNNLKLIDFGFSKVRGQVAEKVCGTVAYIAPEVLKMKYSTQADMWSLGVIVFCLLSGSMPFSGSEQEQLSKIAAGKYSMKKERWGYLANESIDFTRCLLHVDPRKRLTAQQALRHPFISSKHFSQRLQVDSSVLEAMCDFGHQSKFRRSCLFIMAWSLSSEERAAVEEYFLAMDQNHSGAITYEDLKSVMVDKFKIPAKEMKVAFQALSVKGGKGIQYSDFLAAMVSSRIALSNELLQDCFQKFDVTASGFITTDNLVEVLGDKFNGIPTETMLDDVDTLHDGKMCWHEFACFMKGKQLRLRGDEFIPCEDSTDEGDLRKPSNTSSNSSINSQLSGRRNSPSLIAGRGGLPQHPALNPNSQTGALAAPTYREPQCANACSLM